MTPDLLLTFYGDDFSGSTDAMEALCLNGVRAVLFLDPPNRQQITERFPNARAVGVAGMSRSMRPEEMRAELEPKFKALEALDAPLCHYKVCSTFDSSPERGNFGVAIDVGEAVFGSPWTPIVVGVPALGRYLVFGNLFARAGEEIMRLDRHDTMRQHPITPMKESDLRLHLGEQTNRPTALVDMCTIEDTFDHASDHLQNVLWAGEKVVFFDTARDAHLSAVGRLIWENRGDNTLFALGSSGLAYALCAHWNDGKLNTHLENYPSPGETDRILVMSGSASPQTERQLTWALENGWLGIRLDPAALLHPDKQSQSWEDLMKRAGTALSSGQSVIVYSARGPEDPAIEESRNRLNTLGLAEPARELGALQGKILRQILDETDLRRICVAGGDTSGSVVRELGIYALELLTPIAPGGPLCLAHSHHSRYDGLEISLKGGQIGKPDYYGSILAGRS